MSSRRNLLLSGTIAAVIAIVFVSGVVALGVLNTSTTTILLKQNSSTAQFSSSSTSQEQSQSGQSGDIAVLMTDPPTVPNGVTAVYIDYVNLAIHIIGAPSDTGWRSLNSQGELDLMSVINVTQTIADANVSSGTFDELAFNVTSATVTFQSKNYNADLVYQDHVLLVPIVGGITITQGQASAAVIDMTPTVLLLGNETSPTFAFIPAARAYAVPAQSVSTLHLSVGQRDSIESATWWIEILRNSKFEISALSLTPTKLSVTVKNIGNSSIIFRLAEISSTLSQSGGPVPLTSVASVAAISEIFVIEPNATLVPITEIGNGIAERAVAAGGYLLGIGESVTFIYSGNITLGGAVLADMPYHHTLTQQVVPGQMYVITIQGAGKAAQTEIKATAS
jgi:hypothetical protein